MVAMDHLHVTDAGPEGMFEVNTFWRVLNRVRRPVTSLPQVVHIRRGRPALGVAIGERVDRGGRRRLDVIGPALGPDGPYVELIGVPERDLIPDPEPLPEAGAFLEALAAYREDPSDANWERANDALAAWGLAMERRPVPRRMFACLHEDP
jgi:hypothetical protein